MTGGQPAVLADSQMVPGAGFEPAWPIWPADFKGALLSVAFNGLRRFVRQNRGGSLLYLHHTEPPRRTR